MGEEYDDGFKLNTLWREHENKKETPKATMLFGRDIKDVIIWALLAATAGTNDNIQKLLEGFIK